MVDTYTDKVQGLNGLHYKCSHFGNIILLHVRCQSDHIHLSLHVTTCHVTPHHVTADVIKAKEKQTYSESHDQAVHDVLLSNVFRFLQFQQGSFADFWVSVTQTNQGLTHNHCIGYVACQQKKNNTETTVATTITTALTSNNEKQRCAYQCSPKRQAVACCPSVLLAQFSTGHRIQHALYSTMQYDID